MSFQQRHDVIKQVVEMVLTDLRELCCLTSLQEYVLHILVQITKETIDDQNLSFFSVERRDLHIELEEELDYVYTIVTSDFFYDDVTKSKKNLCMHILKQSIFENQEVHIY